MIEKAKSLIGDKCSVAAVTVDGRIFCDFGSSVRPLFRICSAHGDQLRGGAVADKIIGKAAACLLIDAGVSEAFAYLMSESALELLQLHGISVSFATLTPMIENRDGTDMCPMEKTIFDCDDIKECVARIACFISEVSYPEQ